MAKQKKTDRPKKVNIYFDRLSIQVGFMDYTLAGYLFKMIVFYSMGDHNMVAYIQEELKQQHPDQYNLVMMAYTENKVAIDEDLKSYAETCETRRQLALVREANKREQRVTSDHKEPQTTTKDHNCVQVTTKGTNTNTITNTNTKSSVDDVEEIKKEIPSSSLLFDGEDIKKKVDEMLASPIWLEDVQRMFSKSEEDIKHAIREFALMCRANEKQLVDLTDAKRYFVNWFRIQLAEQAKNQARNQSGGTKEFYDVNAKLAEDERKSKEFADRANKKRGIPEDCKYVLGMLNK